MPLEKSANMEEAIVRLYEDESLTEDVSDAPARTLLSWGEEQIKAAQDPANVRRLVKTMARLVRDRRRLSPEEARQRLEKTAGAAWSAKEQAALESLWAEQTGLTEADWAARLGQVVGRRLDPGEKGPPENPGPAWGSAEKGASRPAAGGQSTRWKRPPRRWSHRP
ncbi:MAG: hypothetical protein JXA37_08845 [Chloroflexia bacterium]|nr:hypothetical protein [Chloroflexia bacterium]